jgi:hypothetical protein
MQSAARQFLLVRAGYPEQVRGNDNQTAIDVIDPSRPLPLTGQANLD